MKLFGGLFYVMTLIMFLFRMYEARKDEDVYGLILYVGVFVTINIHYCFYMYF